MQGGKKLKYKDSKFDYDGLRNKLNEVIESGLTAKAIAKNLGFSENDLSRFRNHRLCLKKADAEILSNYLDKVVIPKHF